MARPPRPRKPHRMKRMDLVRWGLDWIFNEPEDGLRWDLTLGGNAGYHLTRWQNLVELEQPYSPFRRLGVMPEGDSEFQLMLPIQANTDRGRLHGNHPTLFFNPRSTYGDLYRGYARDRGFFHCRTLADGVELWARKTFDCTHCRHLLTCSLEAKELNVLSS